MLLTIGYQAIIPGDLVLVASDFDARVIDVRSRPHSTRAGFGRLQLARLLGPRYEWRGDMLGGRYLDLGRKTLRTEWTVGTLWLAERSQRENLLLLCLEQCPGDCHRHALSVGVARDLGHGTCFHIYTAEGESEVIDVLELERSTRAGDDYAFEAYTAFRDRVHHPTVSAAGATSASS